MIIDISPPITADIAVFPGDTPPWREILLDRRDGKSVTLSTLHSTCHLGAHADGPSHYGDGAPAIDRRPLELYVGPCQVVRIESRPSQQIKPGDLTAAITEPRVLFCTGTFTDPRHWSDNFAAFSPDLIDHLAAHGVRLVGIDTPSVDLATSEDLPVHARILHHDMAILEGLVLDHVKPGVYELIALPLPLVGFDASPVRAVLRT